MTPYLAPLLGAAAGGAAGGGLGGLLGQTSDVFSYPRRAIWGALGLPQYGNELLSQQFGMDPESPLTHALGMGAEIVGDPLTYATMGLGGLAGGMEGAALAGRAGRVSKIAEQGALFDDLARLAAERELQFAPELAGQQTRFTDLMKIIDPETLGTTSTTYSQNMNPLAATQMNKWGLMDIADEGRFGKYTLNQANLPETFETGAVPGQHGGNPRMRNLPVDSDYGPTRQFATGPEMDALRAETVAKGPTIARHADRYPADPTDYLFPSPSIGPNPEELALIMQEMQAGGGGVPGFQAPLAFRNEVMGRAARGRAGQLVPEVMSGGRPAQDVMAELQALMAQSGAELGEFDAARQLDPLALSALLGGGLATGGMLGVNAAQPRGQRFF